MMKAEMISLLVSEENEDGKMSKTQPNLQKRTKKYTLPIVGLILGLILFLLPFAFGIYTHNQQENAQKNYVRQAQNVNNDELLTKAKKYNEIIYNTQQTGGGADGMKYIKDVYSDLKTPIAYISIPAIHLDPMVVYYGTSDWVLNRGIGNLPWSSLPTGGKNTLSVLSGHSGLANQIYFDNIRKLRKGDLVFLTSFGRKKAYSVTRSKIIAPDNLTQIRTMNVKPGKDEIALVTCTPIFINSHRLTVFAKRVPLKAAEKKKVATRDLWTLDHIFILVIGLFLLLLLIYFVREHLKEKKQRNKSGKEDVTDAN